jgi:branched-chain amino acid transport system substrate-binding protein
MGLRSIVMLAAAAAIGGAVPGFAQDLQGKAQDLQGKAPEPIKIGVMGDMSGIYQGNSGPGSVAAIKLAVEDFGGKVLGRPITIVSGDHQVKPDIASAIARRWFDEEGVHVIVDAVSSGTSLAVAAIAKDRKRIFLASNAASSAFNMDQCNAYTVQWRSDTYASARAIVSSTLKSGATKWFVIAADYNFGHALQAETTQIVEAAGGKMVGSVRHPVGTSDFSSFILAAQSSGAEIVALANAGDDMVKALKTADEFGLLTSPKQKMVSMLVFITDVHALGLKTIKGLVVVSDFYWDFDDKTRAWAERYYKLMGKMPTMSHAAHYSAAVHYLKAMQAANSDKAEDVMAMMHKIPVDDMYARNAKLRPDNLLTHDIYLLQVKTPEESMRPWDYYKVLDVIPADKAFRPLDQSRCPLVAK